MGSPAVGSIVIYNHHESDPRPAGVEMPAIVASVNPSGALNLAVFDLYGVPLLKISVAFSSDPADASDPGAASFFYSNGGTGAIKASAEL